MATPVIVGQNIGRNTSSLTPLTSAFTPKRNLFTATPSFSKRSLFSRCNQSSSNIRTGNSSFVCKRFCSPHRSNRNRRRPCSTGRRSRRNLRRRSTVKSADKDSLTGVMDADIPFSWSSDMATPPEYPESVGDKETAAAARQVFARQLDMGIKQVLNTSQQEKVKYNDSVDSSAGVDSLLLTELWEESSNRSTPCVLHKPVSQPQKENGTESRDTSFSEKFDTSKVNDSSGYGSLEGSLTESCTKDPSHSQEEDDTKTRKMTRNVFASPPLFTGGGGSMETMHPKHISQSTPMLKRLRKRSTTTSHCGK